MSITTKGKQRAKYDARVEYISVQPEVERMLELGHSCKAIFEEMSRSGRITISYSTFCDYVRGDGRRFRKNQKRSSLTTGQTGTPREAPPGPFVFDKSIDIAKLT